MAELFDNAEFWLPPKFLTDDDDDDQDLVLPNSMKNKTENKDGFGFVSETDVPKCLFPFEFSYGFGSSGVTSDFSSPVESVLSSSETESDEEEYITGLSRQMARSTLEDAFKINDPVFAPENKHHWVMSSSPQSTLCTLGGGCGCGQESNRIRRNYQSHVSSLPATLDLLRSAAGEVAKMMNEESHGLYQNRDLLGPTGKPSPVSAPYPDFGFHSTLSLSQKQLQTYQFEKLRQLQIMKQQSSAILGELQMKSSFQNHVNQNHRMIQNNGCKIKRSLGLPPSAWPPLQQAVKPQNQQNVSGARALVLGTQGQRVGSGRGCAGTGFFLPRPTGNQPITTRKKLGSSTVLVPARVAQALNLNLEEMCAQPQTHSRFNGRLNSENDVAFRLGLNDTFSNQKRNYMRPQEHHPQAMNHKIPLPQEWTY